MAKSALEKKLSPALINALHYLRSNVPGQVVQITHIPNQRLINCLKKRGLVEFDDKNLLVPNAEGFAVLGIDYQSVLKIKPMSNVILVFLELDLADMVKKFAQEHGMSMDFAVNKILKDAFAGIAV